MSYKIIYSNRFKKQLKNNCIKRGKDINKLQTVINYLSVDNKLPMEYCQHKLEGKYKNMWECHIEADWLLIWEEDKKKLILTMNFTGTHSDLFGFEDPDELLY